jgi:hypothetical protein
MDDIATQQSIFDNLDTTKLIFQHIANKFNCRVTDMTIVQKLLPDLTRHVSVAFELERYIVKPCCILLSCNRTVYINTFSALEFINYINQIFTNPANLAEHPKIILEHVYDRDGPYYNPLSKSTSKTISVKVPLKYENGEYSHKHGCINCEYPILYVIINIPYDFTWITKMKIMHAIYPTNK